MLPPPRNDLVMTSNPSKKTTLTSGWLLVVGVMLLCLLGTWLTARNYKANVFSSAEGVVLENQWPESRIAVVFPRDEASHIKVGHDAKITAGHDTHLLHGKVLSVTPRDGDTLVILRLFLVEPSEADDTAHPTDKPLQEIGVSSKAPIAANAVEPSIPPGTKCAVTIDTTIPPSDPSAR